MSRFRIGMGLLAVLLGVSLWAQSRMKAIQAPIAGQITQAEALAAGGSWPQAAAAVTRAREGWEESRTFVAALADHQPMEDIESLFTALEAYGQERDSSEFRAACRELARRIRAMEEAQKLELGSLF